MRKRFRILVTILFVGVLGGFAWLVLNQSREPVYQGTRLSVWLENFDHNLYAQQAGPEWRNKDQAWQNTDEAVRHIGTNAIPILLRLIRAQDSDFKNQLEKWAGKLHLSKVGHASTVQKHNRGVFGLLALGVAATNALPELLRIYPGNPDFELQVNLAEVFGSMGPAAKGAIPLLLTAATNRSFGPYDLLRHRAVQALGNIHAEPETVVPVLITCLNDPSKSVRLSAACALGNFGTNARPAVPKLLELLDDVRDTAQQSVEKIDPGGAAKAGTK